MRLSPKLHAVIVGVAVLLLFVGADFSAPALADSGPTGANGFKILTAFWGTPTTPAYPAPGDQNVPLTMTAKYHYYNTAAAISATLTLPGGMTDPNGDPTVTTYTTGTYQSGSVIQFTFYLDLSQGLPVGAYPFPLSILWAAELSQTSSVSLVQNSAITLTVRGKPDLHVSAAQKPLTPREVNDVSVTLTNEGTGSASDLVMSVSSSAPQTVSAVSNFPTIPTLGANSSFTGVVGIYVADTTAGLPVALTFSTTYLNSYGVSGSEDKSLGFVITSQSDNVSLSVITLSNSVVAGTNSKVSFLVKNTGDSTMYSPTYTFSVSQPLVVAGNSTFSALGTSMAPGASQVFASLLTASPSSTSGIYQGDLKVTFEDQYGTSHTESYSVAINLAGLIQIVIQDEHFSQNLTTITVTGSLLNEGSSPAYYSSVSGRLNGSGAAGEPDYVGEVDVNSPVPFSVSIPYRAASGRGTGNVTILVQYRNSLGQASNSSSSSETRPLSASELQPLPAQSKPSNQGGSSLLELVAIMVAVLVVAGVGATFVLRRRRRRSPAPSGETMDEGSARVS